MRRDIAIVVFPGFQLLDAVGPIAETQIRSDYRRSLVGTLLSRVLLDTMGQ